MSKVVYNIVTRQRTVEEYTPEEQAAINVMAQAETDRLAAAAPERAQFQQSVDFLRTTFGNPRTVAQVNNAIDALTVVLRRVFRELQ